MKQLDFNHNWQFCRQGETVMEAVTIPHDAMILEKRSPENASGAGGAYFAGGAYVYEKTFEVPMEWSNKKIVFQFEGIYQTATIFLNGTEAYHVYHGYGISEFVANDFLQYGTSNKIRIEVDNTMQPNSRWYSGAGIYRPVSIFVLEPDGIELHGVKVKTISYAPAIIEVTVQAGKGTPQITILNGEKQIASASGASVTISLPDASLWSDETPNLYQCKVDLVKDGHIIDSTTETFGVRLLEWSPKGFFVNGKETLLRGGCLHHDNGLLGACGNEEAEWRKVRILKEHGFNAIRSSHNFCTKAMLEACDALGMYMMDETWDMWYRHKSKYDYATYFMEHYKEDLLAMVNKDFNHPSVIFYSIGNEVSEPASEEGLALEKEMIDYLHSLDSSRVVTAGFNLMIISNAAKGQQMYDGEGGLNAESASNGMDFSKMDSAMFNQIVQYTGISMNHAADSDEADAAITPGIDALDIAGYNYASGRYPLEGSKHPDRIIFGSETFPPDIYQNWEMVKEYPYLIGDFMWAAWDYVGEVGIGAWSDFPDALGFNNPYPWLLGGTGVINLLGDPDGQILYAKTVWGLSKAPFIAVRPVTMMDEKTIRSAWRGTNAFPSWSYRDCDGTMAHVEVYGKGSYIKLFLNGVEQGTQSLDKNRAFFDIPYASGQLEAILFDEADVELGRTNLSSATGDLKLRIEPETTAVSGKLLFVNIDLCGENGVVEANADTTLSVSVDGGTLLAYGSANPRTEESYVTGTFTTYYGRSQAIIRVGNEDAVTIHVSGFGDTVTKSIPVRKNA